MYDKLVAKVNNIETRGFALKTKYDAHKIEIEKKKSDIVNLLKNQIIILKLIN